MSHTQLEALVRLLTDGEVGALDLLGEVSGLGGFREALAA
jgi:hypothetical protein